MPKNSILVVGGTGTLGRQVVRKALDEGYEVRCIVKPRQNPADFLRDWGATTVQVRIGLRGCRGAVWWVQQSGAVTTCGRRGAQLWLYSAWLLHTSNLPYSSPAMCVLTTGIYNTRVCPTG